MNQFEKINEYIRNTESSIVNLISAVAPWLAPLAPAFMTYQHTSKAAGGALAFPEWIAIPGAVTVEILGFSTVSTFLAFWFHNRKNQAEAKRAPLNVVIFSFAFYLALILVSNVLLDSYENAKWAVITVRALFTLQSIPAALLVAVRTQHRDLLSTIEKEKADKKTAGQMTGQMSELTAPKADTNGQMTGQRKTRRELSPQDMKVIAQMSTAQIVDAYGCDERSARRWRKDAQEITPPPFP